MLSITKEQKERMEYALQRVNNLNKELNTNSRWACVEALQMILKEAVVEEVK